MKRFLLGVTLGLISTLAAAKGAPVIEIKRFERTAAAIVVEGIARVVRKRPANPS
jgi:hypothetical protein